MLNSSSREATKKRGRQQNKDLPFKCTEEPDGCNSSFNDVRSLEQHKSKCHQYVICGGCLKRLTFASYKSSHIKTSKGCSRILPVPCTSTRETPAAWKLPSEFIKKFNDVMEESNTKIMATKTAAVDDIPQNKPLSSRLHHDEHNYADETGESVHQRSIAYSLPTIASSITTDVVLKNDGSDLYENEDMEENIRSFDSTVPDHTETLNDDLRREEAQQVLVFKRQEESHSDSSSDAIEEPPKKKSKSDTVKYMGCRKMKFTGTPEHSKSVVEESMDPTITDMTSVKDVLISSGDPSSDKRSCLTVGPNLIQQNTATMGLAEKRKSLVQSIQDLVSNEASHDLKLNFKEEISTVDTDGSMKTATNQFSVSVNKGILQLWHLVGLLLDEAHIEEQDEIERCADILNPILLFLHTGKGFSDSVQLLNFLDGRPTAVVDTVIVVLLILASLQAMEQEDNINFIQSIQGRMMDEGCRLLAQSCCILHVLRMDKPKRLEDALLPKYVLEFLSEICEHKVTECINERCHNSRVNSIEKKLLIIVTQAETNMEFSYRPLNFDSFDYKHTISTQQRCNFLQNLLRNYITSSCGNVLSYVLRFNCDPFRRDYDLQFSFTINKGLSTVNRSFYIHSLILKLRLEEVAYTEESLHCFEEISHTISGLVFHISNIICFWKFLHSDTRPAQWDKNQNVQQMVTLCQSFRIASMPCFLYGVAEPETGYMMERFINVFILTNDNDNLSRMCTYSCNTIVLTKPELLANVTQDQLLNVLFRDQLLLEETDVYRIVTIYASGGTSVLPEILPTEVQTRFNAIRHAIRFGTMSLSDFESVVDADNFLDRATCAAFHNNIRWKDNNAKHTGIPLEFYKPYEYRIKK